MSAVPKRKWEYEAGPPARPLATAASSIRPGRSWRKYMEGRCFLVTYRPLVQTSYGRQAVRTHAIPPFIDGSCRREPDFESSFPSITATCRGGNFAPRLRAGDRVAYLTTKGKYLRDTEPGWRLVSVLHVLHRFDSHGEAASWYGQQNEPLPSNCHVEGNPPKAFELTNGNPPAEIKKRVSAEPDFTRAIRLWDSTYHQRITRWPVFLATEAEFLNLNDPPQIHESQMREVFGYIPATLNPPKIPCERLQALVQITINSRRV